jgi:hypothetical protein
LELFRKRKSDEKYMWIWISKMIVNEKTNNKKQISKFIDIIDSTFKNKSQIIHIAKHQQALAWKRLWQENINRSTRRIVANPYSAGNYRLLAEYSVYLGDRERVLADLKKYAEIVKKSPVVARAYGTIAWHVVSTYRKIINAEWGIVAA